MSAYESTVSMLSKLPENDLLKVQAYISRFFSDTENQIISQSNPFDALTEEEIYSQLAEARKHASEGKVNEAKTASAKLRSKYGL